MLFLYCIGIITAVVSFFLFTQKPKSELFEQRETIEVSRGKVKCVNYYVS